jgi:phage terminase large subunit
VARKGNDAKFFEPVVLFKADTMAVASRAAQIFSTLGASIAFVDEGGVGGGVVDRMRQLQVPVIGVNFAASPDNPDVNDGAKYANKRAELYGRMRLWLHKGSIPDKVHGLDMGFVDELTSPMYGLNDREAIQLERKRDMRKRGIKSPNLADALALTFAYTVVPKALELPAVLHQTPDFNPFDRERMVA